jgi:outer membrane protein
MAFRSALIATFVLACAAPAWGATLEVTAAQLFRLADVAMTNGDQTTARRAFRALMEDPSADIRLEARFRLAMVESKNGNLTQAATLLREILDERPSAGPVRLQLAQLLDRLGDKDGAWRQIRAIHASGLPPAVARLVDRYSEALRAQRPFGTSIEIALAPDSNINRATRSDTLGTVLGDFQIGEEAKAKSGTGLSLHAQTYRRLPLGADSSLLFRLTGFADLYRHKQFNDIAADLAVGPELNLGRNRLQLELGATQRWFGQKPFMRSARAAATLSHPVGGRALLRLSGSAALVDNQLNDLQDGKVFSVQLGLERALTATTGVAASFGIDRQSLKDPGYSTVGWRGGLTGWREMGRMTLTAGIDLGRLHADERLTLFPNRRSDRYSRLSIGATFRQIQFRGFAPVARFSIERNRSSVEFYDYRRTRTEIGIVRAF